MNGLSDASGHKRTSITELLNPVAATPPIDPGLAQPAYQGSPNYASHPQYPPHAMGPPMHASAASHYKLTAASWGQSTESERRSNEMYPRNGYPQNGMPPPGMYQEHPPRSSRPGEEQMRQPYDSPSTVWANHAGMHEASIPYNHSQPMIAPSYSDERTSMSGDVAPSAPAPPYAMSRGENMNYYRQEAPVQSYSPRPPQQPPAQAWQPGERASVRVVARNSAPPPQPYHHMPPPPPQYYPPHMYPGGMYPHPQPPVQPPAQPSVSAPALPTPPAPSPTSSQSQKRSPPQQDADEATGNKVKKARTRAKPNSDAASGSRRGYNAKKRNEAAQIAANNAQLLPNTSYSSAGGDKGKQKALDSARNNDGAPSEPRGPLHPELQFARCMSNRYKSENFPRCVSCTRRWAGDTCRFQGIRFFLKDDQQNIVGVSFVENQKADAPSMNFPNRWNRPLDRSHVHEIKRTVAHALLPTLRDELKHLNITEIIRRPRESDVRATCDTCMTSIFSSSWMCRLCGREACAECFAKVRELTQHRPGATEGEIAALQAKRETHAHSNPFFLSCTRRNEHQFSDFSPMSRFCKEELVGVIKDMEAMMEELERAKEPAPAENGQNSAAKPGETATAASSGLLNELGGRATLPAIQSAGEIERSRSPPPGIEDDPGLPSHVMPTYTDGELTEEEFKHVWSKGIPLMVTGVLDKFHIKWEPAYFMEKYQTQTCSIVECQTDATKRVTVGEFFKSFGTYEGRKECWKLKDWPPSTDFKSAFPELYEDFSKAVPMPNYCRRDGVLNIASHFPSNTVAPDLGPKMYNAMATNQTEGSKGSTRLHMDMADAVNIMLHTESRPDGSPGVAVWDLFRWEDADKLRKFMRRRFSGAVQHDPIHSQQIYLDAALREELYRDYGVMSYRVYQKPGEAVFIPAGCAHQVANLSDTIKVAVDFVSPANIARCEKLTGEFREQNQSMAWKEDVLQLRTMMWFAWLSCTRQEAEM